MLRALLSRWIPRRWKQRRRLKRLIKRSPAELFARAEASEGPAFGDGRSAVHAAQPDEPPAADLESLRFAPEEPATPADVEACYRLHLHRRPDPEGRKAHEHAVAEGALRLQDLSASFLQSREFLERRVLKERRIALVELPLFQQYVDLEDWSVGAPLYHTRQYEPHVSRILEQILKPGMRFVDCGANIGYFALLAARLIGPEGAVLAIEPAPANNTLLRASALHNRLDNIEIEPVALGERREDLLYLGSGSNGMVLPFDPELLASGAQLTPARPLDELIAAWSERLPPRKSQRAAPQPNAIGAAGPLTADVLKMDLEGAELLSLRGAEETLKLQPTILIEYNPTSLREVSGGHESELLQLLQSYGYRLAVIEPDGELSCAASSPAENRKKIDARYRSGSGQALELLATCEGG